MCRGQKDQLLSSSHPPWQPFLYIHSPNPSLFSQTTPPTTRNSVCVCTSRWGSYPFCFITKRAGGTSVHANLPTWSHHSTGSSSDKDTIMNQSLGCPQHCLTSLQCHQQAPGKLTMQNYKNNRLSHRLCKPKEFHGFTCGNNNVLSCSCLLRFTARHRCPYRSCCKNLVWLCQPLQSLLLP